jgi:hypothetical protein
MTAYNEFVKQYATDNNLTYRQAQQEIKQNDDYKISKSISKKISQPSKKQQCEDNNMDYNPFTNRCRKKCKDGYERDKYFDCKKIPKPKKPNQLPVEEFNLNVLKFVNNLEEKGQKYVVSGIHYTPHNIFETLMYEYLIEKYNTTNCFLYSYTKEYGVQPLFIHIGQFGLLGNDEYLTKYQKYVYKMIKLIMNCIQKIQNTEQEVLIIPMSILYHEDDGPVGHSNMLIYRKSLNVLEHYEPHGKQILSKTNINLDIKNIMKIIVNKMNTLNKQDKYKYYKGNIKYIPPNNTCIYNEGLQVIENQLFLPNYIKEIEKGGVCSVWSIFFAELSLMNPYMTSKEILDNIIETIESNSQQTKNVIRGYLDYLYNSINPIVENIIGKDMTQVDEITLSAKMINNIISNLFIKKYKNYMSQKFEKYNKVNMKQYFEEPEDDDVFTELTPQNVIPNYSIGMLADDDDDYLN